MTTLHLGVTDIAYTQGEQSTTTGDVADILEKNYGVMQVFFDLHGDEIADQIAAELMGVIQDTDNNSALNLRELVIPEIHALFAEYLEREEYAATTGITTWSALAGYRSTNKSVTANGKGTRPAFVDTSLYKDSMQGWLTP